MGYKYSTRASLSISVYDMTIPTEKKALIAEAQKKVDTITRYFQHGELSDEERYQNVIKVWNQTTEDVTAALQNSFDKYNPIKIMSDSGARGSIAQMRQLAGMRGLMFATNGKTMELPIKSNFREGLNILEYFHWRPRLAQVAVRYGAAYRRLGLSYPPFGRCFSGSDRSRGQVRHHQGGMGQRNL